MGSHVGRPIEELDMFWDWIVSLVRMPMNIYGFTFSFFDMIFYTFFLFVLVWFISQIIKKLQYDGSN